MTSVEFHSPLWIRSSNSLLEWLLSAFRNTCAYERFTRGGWLWVCMLSAVVSHRLLVYLLRSCVWLHMGTTGWWRVIIHSYIHPSFHSLRPFIHRLLTGGEEADGSPAQWTHLGDGAFAPLQALGVEHMHTPSDAASTEPNHQCATTTCCSMCAQQSRIVNTLLASYYRK